VPNVALLIGGGIFSEVGIDLLDHDQDGKVRGRDFSSGDGCFALRGEFGVALEAQAKVGPLPLEYPLAEATLARGRKVISCPFYEPPPPAVLAGLDSATGTLTLFMGPEAHRRDVRPNAEEEAFTVQESAGEIVVLAFGKSQTFDATQVRNIVADGGTKDDRISLVGVNKPSILRGGDGDDVINGGERMDFIDGGAGNDEIFGWGDKDTLVGGNDLDLIYGNDGDDDLYGGEGDDELDGGEGDDEIDTGNGRNIAHGGGGNDEIYGGLQTDVIYGGAGNDTIEGNAGSDILSGDSGIDTIHGQLGDDLIDGGDDGDFLFGEAGEDRLYGRKGIDEIDGGADSDILSGNEDADFLYGRSGADEIFGDEGDDTIDSGDDPDLIYGGTGADTIASGAGEDTIYGGDGADTIFGGDGADTIYGEGLNDTLSGEAGDDTIFGGLGSDTIYGYVRDLLADSLPIGATDRDKLYGERGADRIAGGPHDDLIYGQEDSDQLVGNEGSDTIEGGSGADSIYGFHLTVPAFWSPLTGGSDLEDFLFGNADNDMLYGGPADDLVRGNDGDDQIYGQEGSDRIFGDQGNDTIDGSDGEDTIDGGLGNDHILGGNAADSLFGNQGVDVIEGNIGDDFIAGNDQADLVYGDEGKDTIRGGSGNDTLRGGEDDDTIYGEDGEDLIIGYRGSDTLYGDAGDDVIYGGDQTDNVQGGIGNDRIYGERGDDTLDGNEGDDVIEGGAGNDTISGNGGADALYGDGGEDTILGGPENDFLFAGDGVSNVLNGDEGNDLLVGSDDGDEDPKFGDLTYFGDRLSGGDGDDSILGLGGADVIDGGPGTNTIDGGTHTDQVIHGTDTPGVANFQMPTGPDRRGRWSELSRSASLGGLSNVGGYEEAVYVDESGVTIAWVDWRNGNSEIYVAFHPHGVGDWTPLAGFGVFDSASGGGISNDTNQSRRPTLFKTEADDSLIVAWTSIAADGTSTIEVAREDAQWARITNPAQTGAADDSKFVPFSSHSGLLFWVDTNPNTNAKGLRVAQYVQSDGCIDGFLQPRSVYPIPAGKEFEGYDAAAVEFQGAVAISYGDSNDRDIVVMANTTILENESTFCPAVPNVSFQEYVTERWSTIHTVTDGNTLQPTIGIQYIDQRGQVPGEIELEFDIGVAWELISSRENQVDGLVVQVRLDEPPSVQSMIPLYHGDSRARSHATTISDTIGYADKPDLAMSYGTTYLGWRDDGVFEADGRSSIFVLSRYRDVAPGDYILSEEVRGDASGFGISSTGGSLRDLELTTAADGFIASLPVVLWNEAREPYVPVGYGTAFEGTSVYLRVMLPGLQAVDDRAGLRKFGRFQGNILSNDFNINGEFEGIVSRFDRFELIRGETESISFTSPLGARVTIGIKGNVSYDPNGATAFRQLKRNESLKESFIYRVNNGIHEAEAIVEFIVAGSNVWRNERNHLDVDDDRSISPLDVLILINDLNAKGSRKLDDIGPNSKQFLDVDDDGSVSPLDVLFVINWINSQSSGSGEGEGDFSARETVDTRWIETDMLLMAGFSSDLWMDWQSKQRRVSKRSFSE
jgi:Ca2+-binding RTX toxin-like protein